MYAEDYVKANDIKSYAGLKTAKEKIDSLSILDSEITDLNTNINLLGAKPEQYTYIHSSNTETFYDTIQTVINIREFADAYIQYYTAPSKGIAYRFKPGAGPMPGRIYITDISTADTDESNIWTKVYASYDLFEEKDVESIMNYNIMNGTKEVKKAYISINYYDKNNILQAHDGNVVVSLDDNYTLNVYYMANEIKAQLAGVPTTKRTETTIITDSVENKNYKTWETNYNNYTKQKTEKTNRKKFCEAFKNLTITADITVPEKIKIKDEDGTETETEVKSLGDWPADGVINGNGHKIANKSGKPLFTKNLGEIHDLLSLDQNVATTNSGTVMNCIIKSGTGTGYNAYDGNNNLIYSSNLEGAVYSLRTVYGMDLTKGESSIGAVTDATKLYHAKYANATKKNVYEFKVNINEGIVYDAAKAAAANELTGGLSLNNAVVYIDDEDAETPVSKLTDVKNVAVKKGSAYFCASAELTDGSNSPEFYVPFDFTATALSYGRNIGSDLVSVCLPFALDKTTLTEMKAKAYNFKEVDAAKSVMWFNNITEVAANTPCILAFKTGSTPGQLFKALENVSIASTVNAELSSPASETGEKRFFGNYKANQTHGDLVTASTKKGGIGSAIYGIQGGTLVHMKEEGAYMNAFRSFVLYAGGLAPEKAPVFRVGLLDKDGNEEVVTGIESVSPANGDASTAFKAVGGNNAIEITTGKACDVKVYTLNGALAKTARVEAGTTTLPMNAGMYVVNKTKVIVK